MERDSKLFIANMCPINVKRALQSLHLLEKRSLSASQPLTNGNWIPQKDTTLSLKELINLPQPAHFVAIIGILYMSFVFFPKESPEAVDGPNAVSSFFYIFSFATHFGAQMWMTFVSGIVLFFTIPRKLFAEIQRILFPLYFFLNSILALITIVTFLQHHQLYSSLHQPAQVLCLCLCFLIELCTRIYVVPPLLDSLEQRMELETKADVGNEIGRHDPGVLKDCHQYIQLHRRFRKFHGLCALCNLTALSCNVIHLYFIATTMNISS